MYRLYILNLLTETTLQRKKPTAMLTWIILVTVIMTSAVEGQSCQLRCRVLQWEEWGECSSPCQGQRTREPLNVCCLLGQPRDECIEQCRQLGFSMSQTQGCPLQCLNGGAYRRSIFGDSCRCSDGTRGTCCEQVDGQWGVWEAWGQCTPSCGVRERVRTRLCNSPAPINGGSPCTGSLEGGDTQREACVAAPCPETTQTPDSTTVVTMTTLTDVTDGSDVDERVAGEKGGADSEVEDTVTPASDNTNIFLGVGLAGTVLVLLIAVIIVVLAKRRKDAKTAAAAEIGGSHSTLRMHVQAEPLYENSEIRVVTPDSTEDRHTDVEAPVEYATSEFSLSEEEHVEYNHLGRSREPSPGSDLTYGHLDLEDGDYSHIQRDSSAPPTLSDNLYGHLVIDDAEYDHLALNRTQAGVVNGNIYNG